MGIFSRSSTSSQQTTNNFIDSRTTQADQAGAVAAITGDGNRSYVNVTDGGAIEAGARMVQDAQEKNYQSLLAGFNLSDRLVTKSVDTVAGALTRTLSFGDDVNRRALDSNSDTLKRALDSSSDTSRRALDAVTWSQSSSNNFVDSALNSILNFAGTAQKNANQTSAENAVTTQRATDNAMKYVFDSARPDVAMAQNENKTVMYVALLALGMFAFSKFAK